MIKSQAERMTHQLRAAQARVSLMRGIPVPSNAEEASSDTGQQVEPEESICLGTMSAVVEKEQCIGCGICIDVCREEAVSFHSDMPVVVIDADRCTCCGICAHECPNEAITLPDLGPASF